MRTNRIYEIRLIVAGSRTFHDYKLAKEKLDRIVFGLQEDYPGAQIVIISGDAKGADQIGIRYAMMLSRLVDTFFSRTSWTMLLYAENHSISVA